MASPTSRRSGYNCEPPRLECVTDESLCPPIDVVEKESAHFATTQSIKGDEKEDCMCADRGRAGAF